MHDLLAPFRRRVRRLRGFPVWHHGDDVAAKDLLIGTDGLLAIASERQIRIDMHVALLGVSGSAEKGVEPIEGSGPAHRHRVLAIFEDLMLGVGRVMGRLADGDLRPAGARVGEGHRP